MIYGFRRMPEVVARKTSAVVAVVMFASVGAVAGVASADDTGSRPATEPAEVASAVAAAIATGERVEVLSQRTEYAQVFATPEGHLTVEQHTVPQRVRRGDGSWVPVDSTLQRRSDGTVAPVASVAELAFSGGGAGPLARIAVDEHELVMSWPERLPKPSIVGRSAVYPDVLPGVDLVVSANAEGFSEVLVVKTREAAENPALDLLEFGVSASGVSLQPRDGGFVGVNSSGEPVFTSPAPTMWDSSSPAQGEPGGPEAFSKEARLVAPVDGDRVEQMSLEVVADGLRVTPDRAMLDDPRTVYPVYIDPSVTAARNEWVLIASAWPDQEYHNWTGEQGVGYCAYSLDSDCVKSGVKRLVWEFGIPSAVHGARVLDATFKAYETWAYDCAADSVELWLTSTISGATNWNNHASLWRQKLGWRAVAYKPGCTTGPAWVEFDVTGTAASAARDRWPGVTLGLKAGDESSMPSGWKRFRNDAVLSITYNSYPTTPTDLTVAGKGCGTGSGRPVVADATPDLQAVVHDPDTDETDLKAEFVIQKWDAALPTPAWVAVGSAQQGNKKPGDAAVVTVGVTPGTGASLAHGDLYRWQVRTLDPWSWNGQSGTSDSAWSAWCELEVDTQAPGSPVVTSADYPADGEFHGSVGKTGSFTFSANGTSDVKGYKWGWDDPPTTFVAAGSLGGSVTIPLTPPPPNPGDPTDGGPLTLYVVSVDRADHEGPQERYDFLVGSASGPVGWWRMDEPAGAATLVDSSGNGGDATAVNVTMGAAGRLLSGPGQLAPTVGSFNGASSYAATAEPVLDTGGSFTVSAWARITNKSGYRAVLSQDSVRVNGFALEYAPTDRWVFDMYSADANNPVISRVSSTTAPRLSAWTHLVAVYDEGAARTRLYVDGVLAGTTAHTSTWSASGPLVVGRGRYNGVNNNFFGGDIAEVRVWDRVLCDLVEVGQVDGPCTAGEIAPMATTLVGRWALDGDGTDWSAYTRDADPVGSVTWGTDRDGNPASAAQLDGSTGYLQTAAPVMRTDQSYTVTAWARPDLNSNGWRSVVSAAGVYNSAFFLRRDAGNHWVFTVAEADSSTGGAHTNVIGTSTSTAGEWTHLAGVYDAASGRLSLYVNGELENSASIPRSFPATGALVIGRDRWAGNTGFHLPWDGTVDEVQVYPGAMPAAEVARLYQISP